MKQILCVCIAILLTGCAAVPAKDDYKKMDVTTLEQRAEGGDMAAAFWLGDRYFLDKDTSRAYSTWGAVLTAIEENPKITSEKWFREAYGDYHPVAVLLQLFSVGNELKTADNNSQEQERLIEEIGSSTDDFFVAQERYPQYEPFFVQAQDTLASLGDVHYVIGKYFADMGKREEASAWAERSCKLKSVHGCFLALQTF